MGCICSKNGEKRNTYKLLVGKSEGKRQTTRKTKWVDNIKTDLGEIGLEFLLDWSRSRELSCLTPWTYLVS
jgi:hypothetical protein